MIKVGSDFSGVGAFNQALIRLGVEYKEVFACDMDKYARQTFIHNYGEPEYYPTNVYNREIPKDSLDIYMTSPPCQAFSLAGKRLGKDDKRGILFFNSLEFIQTNKPRYFIFENVKGLLSDDGGKTFSEWVNLLGGKSVNGVPVLFPYDDSVPYHLYWQVLNAKHYGVPQNRERVFLIGIRDDKDNNFRFPAEEHLVKRLKDVLEEEVDEKYFLSEKMINWISEHREKRDSQNNFPMDLNDIGGCVTARYFKMGAEDPYIKINSATSKGYEEATEGTLDTGCNQEVMIGAFRGRNPNNPSDRTTGCETEQRLEINQSGTSNTITSVQKDNVVIEIGTWRTHKDGQGFREIEDGNCPTIPARAREYGSGQPVIKTISKNELPKGQPMNEYKIRRLTPRECFRLMDFPDTFTWPVSDSQAYKQAGNSIVVSVLYKIIKNLNL